MAGDDCSLHFDLDKLTRKQQADHASNQVLTAMLQVALLYIAKPDDVISLYDTFAEPRWARALQAYHALFEAMGLQPAGVSQVHYHPMQGFYESVAAEPNPCAMETLYMVSGSNTALHGNEQALDVSRNLNSKVHSAIHAPEFGLPSPDTLVCRKSELRAPGVEAFFTTHQAPLMLKTLGLAGARNVTTVDSITEAESYLCEYGPDMELILQQRLEASDYTEMTVDLFVSDTSIHVTNVRQIMFADGLWVGNLMGQAVQLPAHHEAVLLQVGEYARRHGFSSNQGFNLGIDYFIRNDEAQSSLPEILVTEINARWTGGLFPAELIRRLGAQTETVVAFIDLCPPDQFDQYIEFMSRHLYPSPGNPFNIAPMGFAPFPTEVEGEPYLYVWQIVSGDFDAFKHSRQRQLDPRILITAPRISTDLQAKEKGS